MNSSILSLGEQQTIRDTWCMKFHKVPKRVSDKVFWKVKTNTLIEACGLLGELDNEIHFSKRQIKQKKRYVTKTYKILQRSTPKVWEHVKHIKSPCEISKKLEKVWSKYKHKKLNDEFQYTIPWQGCAKPINRNFD